MRAAAILVCLSLSPALAARPVARPMRGSLDEQVVTQDAAGVLVRFLGASRAQAQDELDAVAKQQQLSGGLRIGFVKTQHASLAALYVVAPGPVTVARLKGLAAACSQRKGVMAAYVYLHPGPRNQQLEAEGYWTFEAGQQTAEQKVAWRDDEAWVQWARKRLTGAELDAKKWPTWPLSALAVTLGVPGRDFLERPFAVLELATFGFPRDVGENLALAEVYLPEGTLLEVRQAAEKQGASISKVVHDALLAADEQQQLGAQVPTSSRAPWDDEMPGAQKAAARPAQLFLTRALFDKLDAKAGDESVSVSKLVEYAWRRSHPFVAPKQAR